MLRQEPMTLKFIQAFQDCIAEKNRIDRLSNFHYVALREAVIGMIKQHPYLAGYSPEENLSAIAYAAQQHCWDMVKSCIEGADTASLYWREQLGYALCYAIKDLNNNDYYAWGKTISFLLENNADLLAVLPGEVKENTAFNLSIKRILKLIDSDSPYYAKHELERILKYSSHIQISEEIQFLLALVGYPIEKRKGVYKLCEFNDVWSYRRFQELLEHNPRLINVSPQEHVNAIKYMAKRKQWGMIKCYFENGKITKDFLVDSKNKLGQVLEDAVKNDQLVIAELLLKHGADLLATKNILHLAVRLAFQYQENGPQIIELILKYASDAEMKILSEGRPVLNAARNKKWNFVAAFTTRLASSDDCEGYGEALAFAISNRQIKLCHQLLQANASLRAFSKPIFDTSALHMACRQNLPSVVANIVIRVSKSYVALVDNNGETAHDVAIKKQHHECVLALTRPELFPPPGTTLLAAHFFRKEAMMLPKDVYRNILGYHFFGQREAAMFNQQHPAHIYLLNNVERFIYHAAKSTDVNINALGLRMSEAFKSAVKLKGKINSVEQVVEIYLRYFRQGKIIKEKLNNIFSNEDNYAAINIFLEQIKNLRATKLYDEEHLVEMENMLEALNNRRHYRFGGNGFSIMANYKTVEINKCYLKRWIEKKDFFVELPLSAATRKIMKELLKFNIFDLDLAKAAVNSFEAASTVALAKK